MTIAIPAGIGITPWLRDVATATTEDGNGETITRYTGWRAVLDPSWLLRYPATCTEWDLAVVADDALHGPGQCGTDCHDPGDRAGNMYCTSVPEGDVREVVDAAVTVLAEQGFCINGPWVPGPGGTLTAPLMPAVQPDGSTTCDSQAVA